MSSAIKQYAIETIRREAEAIASLEPLVSDDFERTVTLLLHCTGKVVVTGIGKSGIVGRKVAATLSSTGTSAFFLHAGEAYHGDLGMLSAGDIVIAFSNSGETDEILKLVPFLKERHIPIVAITGNPLSTLASHSLYVLNVNVEREACAMNLAPTSSTTAMMVIGDAVAIALEHERGFRPDDYAALHPGGALGRRLLTHVKEVMRSAALPILSPDTPLGEVIIAISNARVGIAMIVDEEKKLIGVITDGDVRRAMSQYREQFFNVEARVIMSIHPHTIHPEEMISAAEEMMRQYKIHSVVVVDTSNHVAGLVEFFNVSLGESHNCHII